MEMWRVKQLFVTYAMTAGWDNLPIMVGAEIYKVGTNETRGISGDWFQQLFEVKADGKLLLTEPELKVFLAARAIFGGVAKWVDLKNGPWDLSDFSGLDESAEAWMKAIGMQLLDRDSLEDLEIASMIGMYGWYGDTSVSEANEQIERAFKAHK